MGLGTEASLSRKGSATGVAAGLLLLLDLGFAALVEGWERLLAASCLKEGGYFKDGNAAEAAVAV